jgi:hypothetical protein
MEFKTPEVLIGALLKNELSVEDLQIAFRYFGPRDRLSILERLEELLTKGSSAGAKDTGLNRGRSKI